MTLIKTYKEILSYFLYIYDLFPKYIKTINLFKKFLKFSNLESVLQIYSDVLFHCLYILKKHTNFLFDSLVEIAGVDFPFLKKNYELNYILLSIEHNFRLRLKIFFYEEKDILSTVSIFPSASWLERECWDMFGIFFKNNPDLRRILTDYGFNFFPLRKDFPVCGYVQLYYDDLKKQIIYEPITLSQEFRIYEFKNPWEQTK